MDTKTYFKAARAKGVPAIDAAKRAKWFSRAWEAKKNACRAIVPVGFWSNGLTN